MKADAIKEIEKMAVSASTPKVLSFPNESSFVQRLFVNGVLETIRLDPRERKHTATDIPSLVDALILSSVTIDSSSALPAGSGSGPISAVWVNEDRAFGYLDESNRRDSVELPLSASPQIDSLKELNSLKWMPQKDLIKFLKNDLYGCLGSSGDLLAIIRQVRFTHNQTVTGNHGVSKASLGNSIEAEITGAGNLPEFVSFDVPVFNNPRCQFVATIICSLDCDLTNGNFQLLPVPLSIETAIAAGVSVVIDRIRKYAKDASVPDGKLMVFAGSP